MKFKKGQAAMEFLMTYGWAILVVLAAIGALAYFGVLSPDRFLPSKCTISGGFSCVEYKIDEATDTIQLRIQNNLGVDATSFDINVTQTGVATPCTYTYSSGSTIVNGGDTGLLGVGTAWDASSCTAGLSGKVKADIRIDYVKSGESVSHSTTGSVSGNVE